MTVPADPLTLVPSVVLAVDAACHMYWRPARHDGGVHRDRRASPATDRLASGIRIGPGAPFHWLNLLVHLLEYCRATEGRARKTLARTAMAAPSTYGYRRLSALPRIERASYRKRRRRG